MFFSYTARILAVLIACLGALQIVMGFMIAAEVTEPADLALKKYTTASTTGEVIDTGVYRLVFGVALGTLAEIALALRRSRTYE